MFWVFEGDLPAGAGIERFGAAHLAYLVLFLTLSVLYAVFYKKLDPLRRKKARRVLAAGVFFFALFEYGVTALLGRFDLYTLPLHVCSLMFCFAPLHALTGGARRGSPAAWLHGFLGAVLFHPGILGVWAALLFPDWLDCPCWHYLSVSGFMAHGLLSVYGASVLVELSEAAEPMALLLRDLKYSLLFLGAGAALMFLFDRAVGANYWFMLGPSADSPFSGVWARGGLGAYLLAYLLTAAAVTALWYALRRLLFVRGWRPASR